MAVAAPVIVQEMSEWVRLGGGNSGIVGNGAHTYGFHRAAREVPLSDYSRRHDPNGADGPFTNMNYACAGDFSHRNNAALRKLHLNVLTRLMSNDPKLSMICEFIGKPWADRPVKYWARWNGVRTLQNYTGQGHDTWSHIAWYRSRADQRAHLWVPAGTTPKDPPYPGTPLKRGSKGTAVRTYQARMRERGWSIGVDGVFGPESERVTRAFQKEKRLGVDGIVGPLTWRAAWESPLT